jgi:hypothetical protein
VGLIALLVSGLRVLLCGSGVLLALRVVAFAMMFGRHAVGLGSVLVVLGGFVVLVSCHLVSLLELSAPKTISDRDRNVVKPSLGTR